MNNFKFDKFDSLVLFIDYFLFIEGNKQNPNRYIQIGPRILSSMFKRYFSVSQYTSIEINRVTNVNLLEYIKKWNIENNENNILNIIHWLEYCQHPDETLISSLNKFIAHQSLITQVNEVDFSIGSMSCEEFHELIKKKPSYEAAKRIFIIDEIIR